MERHADIIVIGLGAWGSAALWRLASRGADVVGIEQYGVPHDLGSSHGQTRLFRVACFEHPGLSAVALESLSLWQELSAVTGETYVEQCGCLTVGAPDSRTIAETRAAGQNSAVAIDEISHDTLVAEHPGYSQWGADDIGLWDGTAGIAFPEIAIRAQVAQAHRLGARVLTGVRVVSAVPDERGVTVTTGDAAFRADQVIVAAGAWGPQLVGELPLQPRRMPMYWWTPASGRVADYRLDRFPAFIREGSDGTTYWGHGSGPDFGIKLGVGAETQPFVAADPDRLDRSIHLDADIAPVASHVAGAFDGLQAMPSRVKACMTTFSPDELFLLGRHPRAPRLIVASGDSFHGFKHAAGVGELLAQIALDENPYCDPSFMDPARFG